MTRVAKEKVAPDSEHAGGRNLRRMLRKYAVTGATHSPTEAHPAGLARQSTTVHPAVSARAGWTGKPIVAAQIPVHSQAIVRSVQARTAVRIKDEPSIRRAGAACRIGFASVTIGIGNAAHDAEHDFNAKRLDST